VTRLQRQVTEFHRKFDLEVRQSPGMPSRPETARLRASLIKEELQEFEAAVEAEDMLGVADALGDLAYVVYGAAASFGIDLGVVTDEIHRSNMTKMWPGGRVTKNETGKVLKPPTYSPADLERVLFPLGVPEDDASGQAHDH
jgi:predicted HAD superfamily Cof-like phosphohydrolase